MRRAGIDFIFLRINCSCDYAARVDENRHAGSRGPETGPEVTAGKRQTRLIAGPEEVRAASEQSQRVTGTNITHARQAELLLLRADGLSCAEIASTLDLNHASIGTLIRRAHVCETYTEYECPACAGFYRNVFPALEANYVRTGKLRVIHYDFPLPMHPYAVLATDMEMVRRDHVTQTPTFVFVTSGGIRAPVDGYQPCALLAPYLDQMLKRWRISTNLHPLDWIS